MGFDDQKIAKEAEDPSRAVGSLSYKFLKLLSESDINRVKDQYYDDAELQLDDAMRRHSNISTGSTPLWGYVLFVYFAYDDILKWCATPLLFYPLVLIFSVLATLYSMGLGPVMIPTIRTTVNMGFRQVGVPFAI